MSIISALHSAWSFSLKIVSILRSVSFSVSVRYFCLTRATVATVHEASITAVMMPTTVYAVMELPPIVSAPTVKIGTSTVIAPCPSVAKRTVYDVSRLRSSSRRDSAGIIDQKGMSLTVHATE